MLTLVSLTVQVESCIALAWTKIAVKKHMYI
jgi:hypothetical protein